MTEEQKEKRREANREYMREYMAKKRQDPSWVEAQRKYHREYARDWSKDPEHRERIKQRNRQQYEKKMADPVRREKERARHLAKYHRAKGGQSQRRWTRMQVLRDKGLTQEEFDTMMAAQNGVCAICKQSERAKINGRVKEISIDHDHKTGDVRGLLCGACNRMLGAARDNPEFLRSAAAYLEKSQPLEE